MIAPPYQGRIVCVMSRHEESKFVAIVDDDDSVRGTLQELLKCGWILFASI